VAHPGIGELETTKTMRQSTRRCVLHIRVAIWAVTPCQRDSFSLPKAHCRFQCKVGYKIVAVAMG